MYIPASNVAGAVISTICIVGWAIGRTEFGSITIEASNAFAGVLMMNMICQLIYLFLLLFYYFFLSIFVSLFSSAMQLNTSDKYQTYTSNSKCILM